MQHHVTATFEDRTRVDQAIDGLATASIPHEQMRLVVRTADGEEPVPIGPHRPFVAFVAVAVPLSAVAATVGSWGAPVTFIVQNAVLSGFLGGLAAAYGAIYFWQVRAAWPAPAKAETQVLTVRGSEEQVGTAADVLEAIAPRLQTGDGTPQLVDGG